MHPHFARLGIHPDVQEFFRPFYTSDHNGNILFHYGDSVEHYGPGLHRLAFSENILTAGNLNFSTVRQVILCPSCMEAIAYLSMYRDRFRHLGQLIVLSTGTRPVPPQMRWIGKQLRGKSFISIFGNDLLGKLAEVKLIAGIRQQPLTLTLSADVVTLNFRMKNYSIPTDDLSLNAVEKCTGYRFGVSSQKPKNAESWIGQLQHLTQNYNEHGNN